MKRTAVFGLTAILLLIATNPAFAVTNGQPDENRHPYVGLAVFDDAEGPAWRCSGALITPTVFLTAGHCTYGAVAARVWFDEVVQGNPEYPSSGATSYDGIPYTMSGYRAEPAPGLPGFDYHDVGVIVLTEPVPPNVVSEYAQLPSEGLVDTLAMNTAVDLVGYGVQYQDKGHGVDPYSAWKGPKVRMLAPTNLIASNDVIDDEFIKLSANAAQGKGGTCFGDSGGPDLLGATDTVLAVNSFVTNSNCAGVTYSNRVDTADILDWIYTFLS